MRLHRPYRSLFLLPVVLAGCSTTVGSRFGGTPQSKSIAVVGERPLPASTGEPGGRVVADDEVPEPRRNPKTRISGRVLDDQGEPVPNITVRLADGGTKGGKDIRGTTDRSGAFTLNGLRPGTTYSLIAEAEDDRGPLTGRVEARTSDTGVEISLAGGQDAATTTRRSARPSRAKSVSNREDLDQVSEGEEAPKVNREDVAPPAEEVDTLDPGPASTSGPGRPQLSPPQPGVGWKNKSGTSTAGRTGDRAVESVATSPDDPPRRRRVVNDEPPAGEEDEPNPLPPAIDPGSTNGPDDASPARPSSARSGRSKKVGAKAPAKLPDSGEIALAPEASVDGEADRAKSFAKAEAEMAIAADFRPISTLEPDADAISAPRPRSIEVAAAQPPASTESAPAADPPGPPALPPVAADPVATLAAPRPTASPPDSNPAPQDVAPTHPAPQPVFASQAPESKPVAPPAPATVADYNPFAAMPAPTPLVSRFGVDTLPSNRPPSAEPAAEADVAQAVAEPPKKKWGELAPTDRPPVVVEPTRATTPGSLVKRLRASVEGRDSAIASCSYDARLRRIIDFRLPDLEGKPVRFQDLDADYVLLDFWGTWCSPCLDSIPHLVALQKKYGPGRFRVVGIACEEGPPEQRKAKVDEASRKLGINYAVLLSTMDGKPCPVQQALQIQAMPTMILVDRRGQILWRSTGSTPSTEERLDRVLASSMGRGDTVRR